MADIGDTVKHMRAGGFARRPLWGTSRHLLIMKVPTRSKSIPPELDESEFEEVIIEVDLSRGTARYDPSDSDILANDWELINNLSV
jgi:hypothetical protein